MRSGSLWEQALGGLGGGTFLFGAGGREVFVLHFNRGPVALHPAEEGTPGPGTESGRAGGDVRLHRQARCNAQANTTLSDGHVVNEVPFPTVGPPHLLKV